MADKPVAIVFHPREWATAKYAESARFKYVHVSIGGKIPTKNDGTPTFDGYADKVTPEGIVNLLAAVKRYKPALLFYWMHGGLGNDTLGKVRRLCPTIKFVHWYSNHRMTMPKGVEKNLQFIDLILMNHAHQPVFKIFRNAGLIPATLWDGFAPSEAPLVDIEPKYDCFFGGMTYKKKGDVDHKFRFPSGKFRYDFINEVGKRHKLALHCAKVYSWPELPRLPQVFHPHYTTAMRQAKITLDLNHFPEFKRAYTRRKIRSIFAERCHITHYIPGMEEDFENHKHLVWFREFGEGLEQIVYYLKHDKKREAIAKAGRQRAMERHTFKVRLGEFEQIVKDNLGI